jgi:ribose 5-phosphate isomerase B
MKIAIGCDKWGIEYKNLVIDILQKRGCEVKDVGVGKEDNTIYPVIGSRVAQLVQSEEYDRGILICGTGIGMAITANKFPGIYAAVCHDIYSAQRSILSNNINVLCMGALVIGPRTVSEIVEYWLDLEFKESPSLEKINEIKSIERKNMKELI